MLQVKDHAPYVWFLFADGEDLLLDVNCSHGAVSYSIVLRLNPSERLEYAAGGHSYLNQLSEAAQHAGPGSELQNRSLHTEYSEQTLQAVQRWRAMEGHAPS